jgi:hypothetical protein
MSFIMGGENMKISSVAKKVLVVFVVSVVLAFTFSVSAATPGDKTAAKVTQIVADCNDRIDDCVADAQADAQALIAKGYAPNSQKVLNICQKLVFKTDAIAANTSDRLARMGVEFVCYYHTVYVGGNAVLIDPLYIIRMPR